MRYAIALAALLAGCNQPPEQKYGIDQCLRVQRFEACMKMLPVGPQSTKYNDWDEVVAQCDTVASSQSRRQVELVKAECRTWQ